MDAAAVEQWLERLPGTGAEEIREWNHTAMNLGRPGLLMAERLPIALRTKYRRLAGRGIESIFEMLKADEAHSSPASA